MKILKNKDKKLEEKMLSKIFNIFESDRGKEYPNKKDLLKYGYCIFLNAKNIQNNKLNFEIADFITESKYNQLRGGKVEYNDIILTTRGTVGNVALNNQEQLLRLNSGMVALRCFKEYNINYLYFILKSNFFSKEIKKNISGGVLNQLPKNVIKKLKIKYTKNLEEQNKIAQLLSEKEQHIENIKTLISKLEKRNEYYSEKLLSGELRVRENEKGEIEFYENTEWKEVKLNGKLVKIPVDWNKNNIGEMCQIKTGKKDSNAGSDNGLYPFFTCSKEIKKINNYSFDQVAILIAGNGVVGASKYYEGKFDAYQRTYVLGDFKINSRYLFNIINKKFQKDIEKEVVGGVINYIKLGNISNYNILVPQEKECIFLLKFIENLDREKEILENLLKKETKEFEWLSEKLLSGEYIIED